MKRLLLFIFILGSFCLKAQTTCGNASPFCASGTSGVDFPATTGTTTAEPGPAYGCLGSEPNPAWYFLQISQTGSLNILIEGQVGVPPNAQQGSDVDFICWGPFNDLAGVCASLTAGNIVDCSYSGSYTETLNIANGIAGQYYMVLITNFANVPQNIVFQQQSGDGTTNCNLVTNNSSICAGGTASVIANNSGNLTNASYSMNPGGVINNTGTFVVNPAATTVYTVYVTGANPSNIVVTQTAQSTVTVNPVPLTSLTTTQTTCTSTLNAINLGLTFNPSLPAPTYTINWSPSAPAAANSTQTIINGGINPGIYTAVITAAGGCTAVAIATVNPPPAASIFTLSPPGSAYTVSCAQPTVFLDATAPSYNYTWTNGAVAPQYGVSTSYNQFGLGTWTVIGQDPASGCVSFKVFTVTLNQTVPTSSVAPVNQNILCGPGVVVTVTGTAISPSINVTHSWYSPGIAVPVQGGGQYSIYGLGSPGTYTYVLTDNVNGCSATKTVQVTSSLGYPVFNVTSPSPYDFTVGCSSTSLAVIHITDQDTRPLTGGSMSFAILPPGYSSPTYTYSSLLDYTVSTPGNYTLIVQDNSNQCETRITVPIIQDIFPPDVMVNVATRTLTCRTPSTILEGVTTTTNVAYAWSFQNGANPNTVPNATTTANIGTNTAISATLVNTYTLVVTNQNNLCKTTTVVPMYQNIRPPRPKINGAGALSCIDLEQTLVNGSTLDEAPGFFTPYGTAAIKWEGPSPQETREDTVSSYKARTVGIYTMTVMDRNNGCITQTTVLVADNRVYPVLQTNSLVALDCGASTSGVNLSVTAVGLKPADVTAVWTSPVPTPDIKNANTLTLTTNGVGLYKLAVTTNSNGCVSTTLVRVENGILTGGITADQETGFAPLTVNFSNTSSSTSSITGTSSITSVWSFGNGTTRTTTTNIGTSTIYNQPGTYTVTVFTSKGSCSDTVTKVIRVDIPSKLEVPNVFTPNGDNSNDIFFIKAANLTEITALIYDRWGNKVYELTTDKGNIAWDGKNLQGKDSPDGTYFYIITAKGKDGQSYDTKGTVSLYR